MSQQGFDRIFANIDLFKHSFREGIVKKKGGGAGGGEEEEMRNGRK